MIQSIVDITGNYIGAVKDGQRNGNGTQVWNKGGKFTGKWVKNLYISGCYQYSSGNVYTGEFLDLKKHGQGIMKWSSGKNKFKLFYNILNE